MKRDIKVQKKELYRFVDGVKKFDVPNDLTGCVDGLYGNVTGLYGHVTGIYGHVTGITGNATGITGCVDDCKISEKDRAKGIDISSLVEEK